MLKRLPLLSTVFFLSVLTSISAQVEKKVVVEHFTNTRCSVCANRNPDFFANLDNHPEVLHIAIHPSSPYSNCLFNNNNPEENDARTNYYGIYGSTPKLVVQGENVAVNADYGSPDIFAPYLGQTSPVSIEIYLGNDVETGSLSQVSIVVEAEHDLGELELFVALVEEMVLYDAPNGESVHRNVFRKELIAENITLPQELGFGYGQEGFMVELDNSWDIDKLKGLVILQKADTKEVVQSALSDFFIVSGTNDLQELHNVNISPNPVQSQLNVSLDSNLETRVCIVDVAGRVLSTLFFQNDIQLDMSDLGKGIYFVELENEEGRLTQKIIKE